MDNINSLPPGPSENRYFQTIKLLLNPEPFIKKCRRKYGKSFTLNIIGRQSGVVICDPTDLKQVLSATSDELHTGELYSTLMGPVVGSGSLFSLDGKKHMQHRKLLLPPLHGRCMVAYGDMMAKIVRDKISSWTIGDKLILADEVHDIAFDIIFRTIFGVSEDKMRHEELYRSLRSLLKSFSTPFAHLTILTPMLHRNLGPITPWAKIKRLRKKVIECISKEIDERKELDLNDHADILSSLLRSRHDSGTFLTNEEISDEMLTLLIAGYDANTMSVCWGLYGVLSDQNIYNKLMHELSSIVDIKDNLLVKLDQLTYLDAVVKESLRVNPVIPATVRTTNGTYQLGSYTLSNHIAIVPCIYLAHRDPDVWSEPDKFIPERFLNSSTVPFSYLPFGYGIRRCIGAAFTQYEMKIIFAQLLLHAKFELKANYNPKMVMRGVAAVPSGGVPVVVQQLML